MIDFIMEQIGRIMEVINLEDNGVLVFKWSTEAEKRSMSVNDIIKLFGKEPLFGHTSGSKSHTHWMCFMKIPKLKK